MRPSTRWRGALLALVLVTGVGCDQAVKHLAITHLRGQPPRSHLGGTVRVIYAENKGAFLSVMAGWSPAARFWLLVIGNAIALALATGYLLWARALGRLGVAALALVVAGGVGNLVDRVTRGVVIDFVDIGVGGLRTGIFNVADVAILAGCVLLALTAGRRSG